MSTVFNADIDTLREYLGQYQRAKRRVRQLERRLKDVCIEMDMPISGVRYSPVSIGPTNNVGQGAAELPIKKAELEERIARQRQRAADTLTDIMDIMDCLDNNSDERAVLELHYIDGMSWIDVGDEMHMARTTVFNKQKAGLDMLLTFSRTRRTLQRYVLSKDNTPPKK